MANEENAQLLSPDAEVVLYDMTTLGGSSIYFKSGPEIDYQGNTYESVPVTMSAETRTVEGDRPRQTMTIGADDYDLGVLKSVLFSGDVDGATLEKHIVELDDLKGNINNKETKIYTIKQVENYSRSVISLIVGRFSPSPQTTVPYKKYNRPAFPYVRLQ